MAKLNARWKHVVRFRNGRKAKCTFLGRFGKYDLYHCRHTVIARSGDEPDSQVFSGPITEGWPEIDEATKRAKKLNLPVQVFFPQQAASKDKTPMKKAKSPRFKVWVEIERLTKDGDEDRKYTPPLPDCVGTTDTEKAAMARAFEIVCQYGIDPENSDCRPRRKDVRNYCKRCGDLLNGNRLCPDKTCPYSDHPQSWDYEKNAQ
jgi:hypothetical protein